MAISGPIGIFDSGVGGLSIAKSIRQQLPCENLLYIADSLHAPYGEKTSLYVENRVRILSDYLIKHGVKAIVVACNTATASSIALLRREYSVPIIGVEPGVKPAIYQSNSRVVGVLATRHTVGSDSFKNLSQRFSTDVSIEVQACSGLVEQVEKMDIDGPETEYLLRRYIEPLLEKGADTLVLGCTHYIFLEATIQRIVGADIQIINTAGAVAKEVCRRLSEASLLSIDTDTGTEHFLTSGRPSSCDSAFSQLWGEAVTVGAL